jgi:YidC/Oxa1 family membrane protein insertase
MFNLIGQVFEIVLIDPLTNLFVLLSTLAGNAGIGVILLTIFIRVITLPLTLKQMHSTRMMAAIGPRMQDIQKRFKDPKRRSEEQMKLYREAGINPLGCFSSMLLQLPILMALYRVFSTAIGETPEALIKVSHRLYGWDFLRSSMPLPSNFLWLHVGRPDPLILPLFVAITTYALQKMSMLPATDEKQRAQNSMMNMMMPLLFGWITINLPSGLGLYYVLSNLIGMAMQYAYVGGGPFNWRALIGLSQDAVLPKALVARQMTLDSVSRMGPQDDDDSEGSSKSGSSVPMKPTGRPPAGGANAARRRRRNNGPGRSRR